jgi:two-component system cell cycle sensor histidine kinase/response regulator CckA
VEAFCYDVTVDPDSISGSASEDRLGTLCDALRVFADATNDYDELLDIVAHTLAAVVKDGCVVRLLDEDGWLSAASIHFPVERRIRDAAVLARVRLHVSAPHNVAEQASARRVIETGEALLVPHVDFRQLRVSSTPEIAELYEAVGIHSLLLVPLRVRGESIGLLSLSRFEPDSPPYGEHDRALARALADYAALAITNARSLQSGRVSLAHRERAEAALQKSEEQLRHAQKMEAVGRLAGGVAHDFNNILSVILSYTELIGRDLGPKQPLLADVDEIRAAAMRAADLTKQLLALSRQQVLEPKILDLNLTIDGIDKLLRRLLGEDIELTTLPGNGLWRVRADPGQIGQILMNLAVNARDAMPRGGKLVIETKNVVLDGEYSRSHHDVAPGSYVMIAVTDTGTGMDKATQTRIFEPFFTTKEAGKGTGLGLSTVYGIVKQSGGHIWVYSEVGMGSTFKVYLPRERATDNARSILPPESPDSSRGGETVLLVEDDEALRKLACSVLRRNGYVVLDAPNGGEAILICEQHGGRIHLLLTDVVLPRMSGRQLVERLGAIRPEMKVLFMSGYTEDAILQHGVIDSGVAFLQKPLTPTSLTRKVREVLSARS